MQTSKFRFPLFLRLTLLIFCFLPVYSETASHPSEAEQVVFVIQAEDKAKAVLKRYEVKDGMWVSVGEEISVSVGSSGILAKELKQEGDGGTPDGTHPIERAFGYKKRNSLLIPYRKFSKKDIWVDDPESKFYNQYLPGKLGKIKGKSVLSNPEIYSLLLVIEHNTKEIEPGKGSMIFIHSWKDLTKPTYGCVGMKMQDLENLVAWLNKDKHPIIVLVREPIPEVQRIPSFSGNK